MFDTLTVTENLEMGGYLLTKPQLAVRIDKVMSTFPALANMRSRTASKLSGGERKMVFLGQSGTDSPAAQSPPGQAARDVNTSTHPTLGREP